MKRRWQFSLASLLLCMSAVAVACAVVPHPYAAFYTLCAILCLAAVLARFGPTGTRAFWFWFSLWGWAWVLVGTPLLEVVDASAFWHSARDWLRNERPAPYNWTPEQYLVLAHSLVTIGLALLGAILVPWLRGR